MAEISQKVQQIIDDNAVVVFSKSYCPYCRQTKKTLDDLNTVYELLELDQIRMFSSSSSEQVLTAAADGSDIQDALEVISGQRTVPNVYIKQKHIGGNSDVQSLKSAGKLQNLLKEAGAVKAAKL
ncbi:hypothetical protein CEP53_007960 [Fusarium sp. AF-6]|nr:hypothetical protein CEP53_007960 [Fusarium sp. AF-6]